MSALKSTKTSRDVSTGNRVSTTDHDELVRTTLKNGDQNIPKLDLHGYYSDDAVRTATEFLESQRRNRTKNNQLVLIITGRGVHSNSGGPVLIGFIDNLLSKRQMEYTKYKSGCFYVNPHSGIVFSSYSSRYNPAMKQDTKVVTVKRPSEDDAIFRRPKQLALLNKVISSSNASSSATDLSFNSSKVPSKASFPSLKLLLENQQQIKVEEEEYQEAIKLSLLHSTKDSIQTQQEQRLLHEAIIASQQNEEFILQQEEERLLLQALDASKTSLESQWEQFDDNENNVDNDDEYASQWEEAIRLSQHVYEMEKSKTNTENKSEARLLQKVLELSVHDKIYFHHDHATIIDATEASSFSNDIDFDG